MRPFRLLLWYIWGLNSYGTEHCYFVGYLEPWRRHYYDNPTRRNPVTQRRIVVHQKNEDLICWRHWYWITPLFREVDKRIICIFRQDWLSFTTAILRIRVYSGCNVCRWVRFTKLFVRTRCLHLQSVPSFLDGSGGLKTECWGQEIWCPTNFFVRLRHLCGFRV